MFKLLKGRWQLKVLVGASSSSSSSLGGSIDSSGGSGSGGGGFERHRQRLGGSLVVCRGGVFAIGM